MKNLPLWHPCLDGSDEQILAKAESILRSRVRAGAHFTDPQVVGDMLRYRLAERSREYFTVVLLDSQHTLIDTVDLYAGTLDSTAVHPREVARLALFRNAAAIIVAHNHPSGNPEPSAADRNLTNTLKKALELVDVRLLDHFVVGLSGFVSMAAKGWV